MAKKSGTRLIVETVLGGAGGCLVAYVLLKFAFGVDLIAQLSPGPASRQQPSIAAIDPPPRTSVVREPPPVSEPVPLVSVPAPIPLESEADKAPNVEAPAVQPPPQVPENFLEVKADDESVAQPEPELRPRAPSADTQKKLRGDIEGVFGVAKARTAPQKLVVAKELQRVANETIGKPDERFVMLRMAAELAADAGDVRTCFEYVDQMANKFDFNLISVKQAFALTAANKASSVPNAQALLEVSNELGAELVDRDLYDDALELTQAALRAASRAADKELIKQATEVLAARKHQNSAWQAYVKAAGTLDTKPEDAKANLAAGRWYASEAKDWAKALPCLEKCGVSALAAAAEADLKDPAKAEEIESIADDWYRLGQQGGENVPLLMRASFWYQQLELIGSGLAKEKAVRRTREIENHAEIKAISKRAALLGVRNKSTPHVRSTSNAPTVQQRSTEAVSEEGKRNPFQESRDDGVLVGFDVTLAKFGRGYRGDSIGAIRPLFQTPTRLAEGNWHGTPKGEPIRVLAKSGFAVADLNAAIGGRIMGLEVEFRRVVKGKLDSGVKYRSDWIGKHTDKVRTITADTRPWNGIFGSWRSDDAWPSSITSLGFQSGTATLDQGALQQRLQSRFGPAVKADGLVVWLDFENQLKRSGLAKQIWTCQAGSRIDFASTDLDLVDAPDGSKAASLKGNGLRILTPLLNGTKEYTFITKAQISKEGECTLLCERTSDSGHIGEIWMNSNDNLLAMTFWSKNKRPDNWMRIDVKLQEPFRNKWCSVAMRRQAEGDRIDVWVGSRHYETSCQQIENGFPGYTVLGGKGELSVGETLFFKRALLDTEIAALRGRQ